MMQATRQKKYTRTIVVPMFNNDFEGFNLPKEVNNVVVVVGGGMIQVGMDVVLPPL